MIEKVGIAIITYNSPDDARACVESVDRHTTAGYSLLLDNSQDFRTGAWAIGLPHWTYIRSPYNAGTCVARNRIAEWMIAHHRDHWVVLDQDVRVTATGWLDDMLAVFQKYPDTGVVSWACINEQMSHAAMDLTDAVPEVAGACWMVSAACVKAVGGWCPKVLYHRFEDSAFCFEAAAKGFKTRLITGAQKIDNPSPGGGTGRNPRNVAVRAESDRLFAEVAAKKGWPSFTEK